MNKVVKEAGGGTKYFVVWGDGHNNASWFNATELKPRTLVYSRDCSRASLSQRTGLKLFHT